MRILFALLLFCSATVFAQLPKRPTNPSTAYNEFSKEQLLSAEEAAEIEQDLRTYEEETSNAIVVVVVDNLQDMEIEEYADKLGEAWGVGTKADDNGIILLIKPFGAGDKKVTIQVGRGLESVIPDIVCKDIIEREFIPNMKEGNPVQAIKGSIKILKALAKKEYNYKHYQKKKKGTGNVVGVIFAFIIISLIIYSTLKGGGGNTIGGSRFGGGYWGGFGGGSFRGGSGSSGGFGGFGGGSFGGGGASGSW